jgi:hypothetical protein
MPGSHLSAFRQGQSIAKNTARLETTEDAWVAWVIEILCKELWGPGAAGVEDPRCQIDAEDASFDDSD